MSAYDDLNPWVQFDFDQPYLVIGITVRKRCDEGTNEYVTSVRLAVKSHVTDVWNNVGDVIEMDYGSQEWSTVWLPKEHFAKGQNWRIYPVSWEGHCSMKADLIGRLRTDDAWCQLK